MESNGHVTPSGLLASARREVTTSLGIVLIRRIGYAALAQIRGELLDLQSLVTEKPGGEPQSVEFLKTPAASRALQAIEGILRSAVLTPTLGIDPAAGPVPSDFPIEDQLLLVTEILDLSGYSKRAAEEVRP